MTNPAAASQPPHTNRLAKATSPYLLQHAHNPVDWYEWGSEGIERAKRENKPIFLSIGYAACHWCHVMAHESFEDEATAAVMNQRFVCIKVDREERPDLDEIYMRATVLMNRGSGGWPMSVFLTPDLKPFFAGTYFPNTSRYGLISFKELCEKIGELWQTRRENLLSDAERLTAAVAEHMTTQPAGEVVFTLEMLDKVAAALAGGFDAKLGGIISGNTNKFPPSMALDMMLRSAARQALDNPEAKRGVELAELTLERMAHGGIYDQLAGGICRYSTDVEWLVPHFEKMLYDQALVSRMYIDAWKLTRKPLYAEMARSIFDYVMGDFQSPAGGFFSARDADSEGEEGKFYVWTKDEVLAALGRDDGELFCSYYDVSPSGNWDDPHAPRVPKNILHVPRDLESFANLNHVEPAELQRRLAAGRATLLAVRSKRVPPGLDDKVLCEWNGLMIAALARGGAALNEPKYIVAAARAADAILKNQFADGRLFRAFRDGRRTESAFLTDYADMIDGLLELYEASFDKRWLELAIALNATVLKSFGDANEGGFFFTPDDHEKLLVRAKDIRDSATPSGNSVQLSNLLRLSAITGDAMLRTAADKMLSLFAADVLQSIGASERFLCGVELALVGPVEIAIVGDPADARTQALLRVAQEAYLPNRTLMLLNPADPKSAPQSPLLENREMVSGQPAAYVCRNYACQRPVTTAAELRAQLSGGKARR